MKEILKMWFGIDTLTDVWNLNLIRAVCGRFAQPNKMANCTVWQRKSLAINNGQILFMACFTVSMKKFGKLIVYIRKTI
jgi:hypothetical protein